MSAAAHVRGLAYEAKSRAVPGGGFAMHAVARCVKCRSERTFRLPRDSNNPEAVQKLFRDAGWQFDSWNRGSPRCPDCLARAAENRRGESPKEDKVVQLHQPGGARPALALPPNKTELTAPERGRLRQLLDGVFDADKGFYIEAYSDAKVAAEIGLPEKLVRDYRDVAFGPIKSVPELDEIKAEVATLQARATAQLEAARTIDEAVGLLKRKVEETARRLGVKA